MPATLTTDRRDVNYASLDDFRADIETLAAGPVSTVGNWSFGQILTHLARTMNSSIDGFPFKMAWPIRTLLSIFFKRSILHKKMSSGYKLPKRGRSLLPEDPISDEEGVRAALAAIERVVNETPTAEHPFMGRMTPGEWKLLHLRHAELHMSFARPADG